MTRLAVRNRRGLEVSPVETARRGTSYTIFTVRAMRRRFPDREIFFIVGADTARDLPTWKCHRELLRLVRFAVIARPGTPMNALPGYRDRFVLLRTRGIPLASNRLRQTLAKGRIPAGSIPGKVARYIRAHGLYDIRSAE
jgi:nicotinate-nucleotide adenylyltransferase